MATPATRPARSATTIPVPTSSARASRASLDTAIPLFPSSTSPTTSRPRMASTNTGGVAASPSRSASASYSSALSAPRMSRRESAPVTYQPRVIRAATSPSSAVCVPPGDTAWPHDPATERERARTSLRMTSPPRPALRAGPALRTASTPALQPGRSPLSMSHTATSLARTSSSPGSTAAGRDGQAFPRPAYLEYSALRQYLHTEAGPSLPPPRARGAPTPAAEQRYERSPSPPAYPYLRRDMTPLDSDRESTASPPPRVAEGAAGQARELAANPVLRLPTRWSDQDRQPMVSVSEDGRELRFTGPSCLGERDSAAARANYSIPAACGVYYYEVEIVNKGHKGHISIGFAAGEVRLSRLPGWEKRSWGYHADDGWAFPGQKEGSPYGPTFETGDVVGCGIDFSVNKAFFTKNGSFLGLVFDNIGKEEGELYPAVGMRHAGECVRANFGSAPFRFAIADRVRTQRDAVWESIMSTKIDWVSLGLTPSLSSAAAPIKRESEPKEEEAAPRGMRVGLLAEASDEEEARVPMQKLVLAYLEHNGYAGTARAFRTQCRKADEAVRAPLPIKLEIEEPPACAALAHAGEDVEMREAGPSTARGADADDADLGTRLPVYRAVLAGDVDGAISGLRAHHPAALNAQEGLLLFRLRCQKFVQLVLQAGSALRRVREEEERAGRPRVGADAVSDGLAALDGEAPAVGAPDDADDSMEVDDPPHASGSPMAGANPAADAAAAEAKTALKTVIQYGQTLEADYKTDSRPAVRAHLRRTFGVVAYQDPERAGGSVGAMAGQQARAVLAEEVNRAILESQGRPAHPALEMLYRQTAASIVQLGMRGMGSAAFADIRKEFLEN